MKLEIDQQRLNAEIETLAAISDAEPPAVTRIVFTPADLKARAWMIARCEETGLAVRQDAIGNIFARWNGADPGAPAVGTGSHIDAIPNAGSQDSDLASGSRSRGPGAWRTRWRRSHAAIALPRERHNGSAHRC